MSLEFYISASGHGKTYRLYKYLIDESIATKDSSKRFILVVPEQSSLQAQKDIVRMHPNHGVFNIDVVTFGRLAYRIFEELGVELNESIDDTGKNLIVRKVISKVAGQLRIIHPKGKQGFVSEIKSMISELKQYGISIEELKRIIEEKSLSDRLKQKLMDLLLVYEAFEDYKKDRFVTVEDRPEELLKVINRSSFFDNAVVAFDGFTGFTPVQYRIIENIMIKADHVINTVTLPVDSQFNVMTGEDDLFFMSKNMMYRMGRIADKLGIKTIYLPIETDVENYRFAKSKELDFLEKELFRYNDNIYDSEVNDIKVRIMNTPKEEVMLAAADIIRCIREHNLRYRDIAVIAGDMSTYGDEIQRIFTESEIPFFMDRKRSLIGNPVVEYIRSAIEIIKDNYSYESVFRFLKNGLCGIDCKYVDIMENYVLALGIRGRNRWNEMFVRNYNGKGVTISEVNETRTAFIDLIEPLDKVFSDKDADVSAMVRAVYDLLEKAQAFEYLEQLADDMECDCEDTDSMIRASEYRMTYKKIIELLEQIDGLLGEENVTVDEFATILDAGFEEIKVGIIPPSVDCVTVGDVERTRLEHVKVLIMLGVNEGILPKTASNKGILSENERKVLGDNNVELAPTPRERIFIQNFYLYLNMTEPEKALYLSCHKYNSSGKEAKPSRIINMITKMFPKLSIETAEQMPVQSWITNCNNSIHLVTEAIINADKIQPGIRELLIFYVTTEPFASKLKNVIEIYSKENSKDGLAQIIANELYREIDKSSISRMETYAKCAFAHFAEYGLELMERPVYEINPADMGNIFHKAIECISLKLKEENRDFSSVTDDERYDLVKDAVMDATVDYNASFFTSSGKNAYLKQRIINILDRTVWALGKQLKSGRFLPVKFESGFFQKSTSTSIVGKIDRIDLYEQDNKIYVKIIDYKSGNNDIELDEIYNGLKLQLMVYLNSAVNKTSKDNPDKEIVPAGALYNRIDNPIVNKDDGDFESNMLKELRPTGMIGIESVHLMDDWDSGNSLVIPAKKKKGGEYQMDDHLLTGEQIKCVSEYAVNKMTEMEQEIMKGMVNANPYEDSCKYCPYSGVCGFDSKKGKYRKITSIKDDPDKWKKFGFNTQESDDTEVKKDGMD